MKNFATKLQECNQLSPPSRLNRQRERQDMMILRDHPNG